MKEGMKKQEKKEETDDEEGKMGGKIHEYRDQRREGTRAAREINQTHLSFPPSLPLSESLSKKDKTKSKKNKEYIVVHT